jgi:hypothetical protein
MRPEIPSDRIWIGEACEAGNLPLGYADDRHVCLVSGARGGKGTGVIVPNLCLWPGSAVVIDPKGENATVTAQRRGMDRLTRGALVRRSASSTLSARCSLILPCALDSIRSM